MSRAATKFWKSATARSTNPTHGSKAEGCSPATNPASARLSHLNSTATVQQPAPFLTTTNSEGSTVTAYSLARNSHKKMTQLESVHAIWTYKLLRSRVPLSRRALLMHSPTLMAATATPPIFFSTDYWPFPAWPVAPKRLSRRMDFAWVALRNVSAANWTNTTVPI